MRRGFVNFIASSPLCPGRVRMALLRRFGVDVRAARIDPRCFFGGPDIVFGDGSIIGARCIFDNTAKVEVGPRVVLGPRVMILTSTHEFGSAKRRSGPRRSAPVTLGAGCRIGAGTTVLAGSSIGEGCVVHSGSLVRESLPPHGEYAGVPARLVRQLRG